MLTLTKVLVGVSKELFGTLSFSACELVAQAARMMTTAMSAADILLMRPLG
jgi:hypothetical protein